MTILEIESLSGLDRASIRFYEREGLICPERKENGYRDYSDADLQEILRIKLLRQLDLPLNQIKALQQGSADIASVFRQHTQILIQQMNQTAHAAQICQELSEATVSYNSLDAAVYLEKMKTPEAESASSVKSNAYQLSYREYHPVRRLAARILDYAIVWITIHFLLIVILRIRPFDDWLSNLIGYAIPFLCVPLMALSLSKFGTTPGKWMMGIVVEDLPGRFLRFRDALMREWNALRYGYGFGIPIWSLWRLFKSYKEYNSDRYLEWDLNVDYSYTDWSVGKKRVFAAVLAFIVIIYCTNVAEIIKPRYRGTDLTVAEFAENYNYYAKILESSFSMNDDGTWYVAHPVTNGATIEINMNKAEKPNEPFCYEMEGERISRITYENSWTDVFMLQPLNAKMITAMVTLVCSQKGVGISKLLDFLKLIQQHQGDSNAQICYENIEIRWVIHSTNCFHSSGKFYIEDENKPSNVSLDLEIIIHETN